MTALDLFTVAEAWASAAGAEHHAPSVHQLWFPLINFAIFVFLAGWLLYKKGLPGLMAPLKDHFRLRREEFLAVVGEAEAAKQGAEATVLDYQGRLERLDQEVQSIRETLRAEGDKEKTKLLSKAHGLAAKIKEDAQFLAEQEVKVARQKVRAEMADRARSVAAELVRRNLSYADQGRLVEEFVQDIGQVR